MHCPVPLNPDIDQMPVAVAMSWNSAKSVFPITWAYKTDLVGQDFFKKIFHFWNYFRQILSANLITFFFYLILNKKTWVAQYKKPQSVGEKRVRRSGDRKHTFFCLTRMIYLMIRSRCMWWVCLFTITDHHQVDGLAQICETPAYCVILMISRIMFMHVEITTITASYRWMYNKTNTMRKSRVCLVEISNYRYMEKMMILLVVINITC